MYMDVLCVIIFTAATLCFGAVIRDQCSRTSCPSLSYDENELTYNHRCRGSKMIVDFQCINGDASGNTRLTCQRRSNGWFNSWESWYWTGTMPTCTRTSTAPTPPTSSVSSQLSTITSWSSHSRDTRTSLVTSLTTHSVSLNSADLLHTTQSLQLTTQSISPAEPSNSIRKSSTDSTITTTDVSRITPPTSCTGSKLLSKLASLNVFPLNLVISNLENSTFPQGESILHDCANNYRFINGTLDQVCGADGNWKGELPVCKRCKCPCTRVRSQVFIKSQEELQSKIDAITKQLKVEKSHLSSEMNKKISAADPRPTAKAVGSVLGIGTLVFIAMCMVLSDVPTLYKHFRYGPYA